MAHAENSEPSHGHAARASLPRSRRLAASLMLLSGVTHVAQLGVYGTEGHVVGAAAFGVVYFVLGIFLMRPSLLALWFGACLPSIGGVLGLLRFATTHANPFSLFHVAIDLVVVPICVYWLLRIRRTGGAEG